MPLEPKSDFNIELEAFLFKTQQEYQRPEILVLPPDYRTKILSRVGPVMATGRKVEIWGDRPGRSGDNYFERRYLTSLSGVYFVEEVDKDGWRVEGGTEKLVRFSKKEQEKLEREEKLPVKPT